MVAADFPDFASKVIDWQKSSGRHDLPWQNTRDPYRVWVSEIMLQQTQVAAVIPYYQRFMARFPDCATLAEAHEEDVLALWSGLGYYARGRNLHRAARRIRDEFGGKFPDTLDAVMQLPGVGRSTAGAICAFAFGHSQPILDGNVKRVLTRVFGMHGFPGEKKVEAQLWMLAAALMPRRDVEPYTQGLMDLGARVCVRSRPLCTLCPLAQRCIARRDNLIAQLPTPRPRRVIPHRRANMLLLWDGREVLLERRPPTGIWGGMWCLPQSDSQEEGWMEILLGRYGVQAGECVRLETLEHGFTHFSLSIDPYLVRPAMRAARTGEPAATIWLSLDDALQAALPVPVRKLLMGLREPMRPVARPADDR